MGSLGSHSLIPCWDASRLAERVCSCEASTEIKLFVYLHYCYILYIFLSRRILNDKDASRITDKTFVVKCLSNFLASIFSVGAACCGRFLSFPCYINP